MNVLIVVIFFLSFSVLLNAQEQLVADTGQKVSEVLEKVERKAEKAEKLEDIREQADEQKRIERQAQKQKAKEQFPDIEQLSLPQDNTAVLDAKQLQIAGNTLISTKDLLDNIPPVYNASDQPITEADSSYLFDLRVLHDIIHHPGTSRQVSMRTIQGFTQYVLSEYQGRDYAGIYVYVPADAIVNSKLRDQTLRIQVLEAKVSQVNVTHYDVENNQQPEGVLKESVIREWSPVELGKVANKKQLDDFVNLLNNNPDRYVSAVVSQGDDPDSLKIGYDVYEAAPWHWYVQVDNSGTKRRKYSPRAGFSNTNLTGSDDRLDVVYQGPVDNLQENYSAFGSYDFPVLTPRLRLRLYAGYSEFDTSSEASSGLNFFGNGSFAGGVARYNLAQQDGWFYDLTASVSHERSKVTSSLFNSVLGSVVRTDLWGIGADIHKSDDMSGTSLVVNRLESMGGSNKAAFTSARAGTQPGYSIYTIAAGHWHHLDQDKIQRFSGSLRWTQPNERLIPSRMSTFGGMYTVRGYPEDAIVADGGILASLQYEYDLVKHDQARNQVDANAEKPFIRKLAPLGFFDFGRAKMKHPVAGEKQTEELASIGAGLLVTLGDNIDASVFYGHPLRGNDDTRKGRGRWNMSVIVRW